VLTALVANVGVSLYVAYGAVQSADPAVSGTSIETFLQYGVLGLVVIGFLTGWIVPGPQAKLLISENARLQGLIEEKVIPLTATYSSTMERSNVALEKAAQAMETMNDRLDKLPHPQPGEQG
jgi:fructose-specific phosphotransferase system IIC component